jgi:hypothetical protein
MACFQTKNPILGKFWRDLKWKILVFFMAIWFIVWPFGLLNGHLVYSMAIWSFYSHLVYFIVIWYIFPCTKKKSGNPAPVALARLFIKQCDQMGRNSVILGKNYRKPVPI